MAKTKGSSTTKHSSDIDIAIPMPIDEEPATPDEIDAILSNAVQDEPFVEMDEDDWDMALQMEANYTDDQLKSQAKYISQSKAWSDGGDGQHSFSQVLNHLLNTDQPLTTKQQQLTLQNLKAAAQPITKNLSMIRAAHADVLQRLGIKDYTKMTDAQLQKALVGVHYHEKAFQSMSWNEKNNPFIHGAPAGGRQVFIKISAPKGMKVAVGDKMEAEFVGMPGQGYTIKKVYFDGSYAYPASTMQKTPRVVIEVVADV